MQMFETQQGEGCFCYFEAKKTPTEKDTFNRTGLFLILSFYVKFLNQMVKMWELQKS